MKADREFYWSWEDAITESNLPPLTRLVLLTLSTFMNAKNTSAYPSQDELARCSGLSRSSVYRHLQAAEAAGFIEVKKHGFAGQNWANNEYHAVIPHAQKVASERPDLFDEGAVTETQRSSQSDTKDVSERPTNLQDNQPSISLGGEIEFELFWKAYPFTSAQNPSLSQKLWKDMSEDDRKACLQSLPAYASATKDVQASYPYVYLRDRVWEYVGGVLVTPERPLPFDAGSTLRKLFERISKNHGRSKAWAWFGPEKASQDDAYPHLLIAAKPFIAQRWKQEFINDIKSLYLGVDT